MRNTVAVLLSCSLVAACSVSNGHELTDAQVDQFTPGRSTMADVETKLGNPSRSARNSDGSSSLVYQWGTNTASGQNYIPLVGPFIAKSNYTGTTVTYTFLQNGILKDFKKESENQRQGMVN